MKNEATVRETVYQRFIYRKYTPSPGRRVGFQPMKLRWENMKMGREKRGKYKTKERQKKKGKFKSKGENKCKRDKNTGKKRCVRG
jgi:hypothetical protein